MRDTTIRTAVALAIGLAWASGAAAQDGTPLAQRRLEGRVVDVRPQDHALVVDTTDRAHARVSELAEAGAHPARVHARRAVQDGRDEASGEAPARAGDRKTARLAEATHAPNAKLELAPGATVVRDGLNVPLDQIRPGDEIRASFLSDDLTRTRPWKIEARSPHGREAAWGVGTGAGG